MEKNINVYAVKYQYAPVQIRVSVRPSFSEGGFAKIPKVITDSRNFVGYKVDRQ